jgi:hypothetical protein
LLRRLCQRTWQKKKTPNNPKTKTDANTEEATAAAEEDLVKKEKRENGFAEGTRV